MIDYTKRREKGKRDFLLDRNLRATVSLYLCDK
jgi:hypothetical protein